MIERESQVGQPWQYDWRGRRVETPEHTQTFPTEKPGPTVCFGVCRGDRKWLGSDVPVACTVCSGKGKVDYPTSWQDEYEAMAKAREEKVCDGS
jgi:hypothetical protein